MLDGSPLQCYVPLDGIHASFGQESNEVSDENVGNHANIALSTKRNYTFINKTPKTRAQPVFSLYVSVESAHKVSHSLIVVAKNVVNMLIVKCC